MPDPASKLVTLTSSPSEFEAAAIAAALSDQGIPARVSGGTIAGFRAEVPGEAQVLVFEHDLERARNSLRVIKSDSIDIDWDHVDVGAAEDAAASPRSEGPLSALPHQPLPTAAATRDMPLFSPNRSRWFWAGALLLLSMLIPIALATAGAVFSW